jgi:LysM repeat protein
MSDFLLHHKSTRFKSPRSVAIVVALALALVVSLAPVVAFAAPTASSAAAPANSGGYHLVRPGDTLSGLARYYGTTIAAIKQANGLTSNTIVVGQRLKIPGPVSAKQTGCSRGYTVRHGDTLSSIARHYGVNTAALAAASGLSNASYIEVGQRICIPNIYSPATGSSGAMGGYYTVQPGDTLSQIAKNNMTTVKKLMHLNHISNPSYIYIGQKLRLH